MITLPSPGYLVSSRPGTLQGASPLPAFSFHEIPDHPGYPAIPSWTRVFFDCRVGRIGQVMRIVKDTRRGRGFSPCLSPTLLLLVAHSLSSVRQGEGATLGFSRGK